MDKTKEIDLDNIKVTQSIKSSREQKSVPAFPTGDYRGGAGSLMNSFRLADGGQTASGKASRSRQQIVGETPERAGEQTAGRTSRNAGTGVVKPQTTGFTFDDEALRVNDMEEHVDNLGGRLNMSLRDADSDEGCINVEDEGSAHQTYDKSESV